MRAEVSYLQDVMKANISSNIHLSFLGKDQTGENSFLLKLLIISQQRLKIIKINQVLE